MDNKSKIVCEFAFLEKFINSLSGIDLLTFMESGEFFIQKLFELIFSNSMVYLDLSVQEITTSNNPYIKKLIRQGNIKPYDASLKHLKPTSLYLIDKERIYIENTHSRFGNWAFNFEEKLKLADLFVEKSYNYNFNNTFKNFDFLHKYHRHPHNAMIITDDYFFKNAQNIDDVRENFQKIFSKILPKEQKIEYHLTIITANKTFSDNDLKESIGMIFQNYPYDLKLEILAHNFHKRILLTNYYYLTADKGLLMNKANSKKNDFYVSTIFYSEASIEAYCSRIEELRHEFPNSLNRLLQTPHS
jgi:hypothetical protein